MRRSRNFWLFARVKALSFGTAPPTTRRNENTSRSAKPVASNARGMKLVGAMPLAVRAVLYLACLALAAAPAAAPDISALPAAMDVTLAGVTTVTSRKYDRPWIKTSMSGSQ